MELLDLYSLYKRAKREPARICAEIEAEGGRVLESRAISRLKNSPFKRLRVHPLLYEFRVHYGRRRGRWYVRTSDDGGEYDWAWADGEGYDSLPIARIRGQVARNVQPVGWVADSLVVGGLVVAGLAVCFVLYRRFL